jgi:hypothetical protein
VQRILAVTLSIGLDNREVWGPRGSQNVEAPISNNKFRLFQIFNIISCNKMYKLNFRDSREANVSVKSMDSVSVF